MSVEAEIHELLESLVDSWNRGDGAAFASLFAPDADYVTGDGEWLHGRSAIEDLMGSTKAGARASLRGTASIRVLGAVATAVFRWGTVADAGGVVTCVVVRGVDGRWLIDRLQNTDEVVRK